MRNICLREHFNNDNIGRCFTASPQSASNTTTEHGTDIRDYLQGSSFSFFVFLLKLFLPNVANIITMQQPTADDTDVLM